VDNIKLNMTDFYNTEVAEEAPHLLWVRPGHVPEFNRVGVQFEIQMQALGVKSVVQTPTPTPAPQKNSRGMGPGNYNIMGF
jgi:hypothetical protein